MVGGSSFVIWDLNPSVLPLAAPVTGKSKALVPKVQLSLLFCESFEYLLIICRFLQNQPVQFWTNYWNL